MPKTKFEALIFTLVTSGIMIYIMGTYNIAINSGGLKNSTFLDELYHFPLEYLIGFILAFFVASNISKALAFKIVVPTDRPILIILAIQVFTVCTMVPLMGLMGVLENGGINANFIPTYLTTICENFLMALPLQVFLVGPFVRFAFRKTFRRKISQVKVEVNKRDPKECPV